MKRRLWVFRVYGLVFLFMGVMAVRRVYTQKTDFDGFWRAGRAVLDGRSPYEPDPPGTRDRLLFPSLARPDDGGGDEPSESAVVRYLPFFAVFMAPFALLPMDAAVALWHILSCAALLGAVRHAWRLSGTPRALESPEAVATLAMTGVFWIASMTMGQIGLVTLYLSLAGIDLAQRGRPWLGGALAGLSTAIKVMPGVVGVYFLLKRRWAAAAGTAAAFAACVLVSALALGPKRALDMHQSWRRESAATAGAKYFELRDSVRFQNQSLHAFMARTLMKVNAGRSRKPFHVNVADLSPAAVANVTRAVQAALALAALWVLFARRTGEPFRLSEAAVALALTTFISPIAWTFHMAILIPAFACLWERRREKEARVWMIAALVLELGIVSPYTRALGFLTWSCLVAGIGAWRVAMKEKREVAASPAP